MSDEGPEVEEPKSDRVIRDFIPPSDEHWELVKKTMKSGRPGIKKEYDMDNLVRLVDHIGFSFCPHYCNTCICSKCIAAGGYVHKCANGIEVKYTPRRYKLVEDTVQNEKSEETRE